MSHYKPYPAYKDSGVEWLGQVPVHWNFEKLKYIAKFSGGGTPSRENATYWNGDIPWVSPKDMKSETIHGAEESISVEGLRNSTTSLVAPDHILIVVRSGILKHTIPVAINEVEVALNQDMKAVRLDSQVCSSQFFLRWVQGFNDDLLQAWLKQGATVESIEQEFLAGTIVPLPPILEQRAIIAHLDRETTRIDGLVSRKTRFIELLREKRQALITHAVTKGLDPSAPMKDSGVEWLGDVPAHWTVGLVKHWHSTTSGGTPDTSRQDLYYTDEGGYPWIRTTDLDNDRLTTYEVAITDAALRSSVCVMLPVGTVLVAMYGGGGTVGKNALLNISGCINQALCGLLPTEHFLSEYTFRYIQFYKPYWMIDAESSRKDPNISQELVRNAPMLKPPHSEQQSIVNYLDRETSRIDTLIGTTESSIGLLKERRNALITAAVTGQIDLREAE